MVTRENTMTGDGNTTYESIVEAVDNEAIAVR
jgi:hypothetical protein